MFKKGEAVVVYHKLEKKSFLGIVESAYRRQKIQRYDVKIDRGILEFLSEDPSNLIHIKTSAEKLKPLNNAD